MKSTGMIRRIDELGRVVIPKEIRKSMNLKEGAELEIYTQDEKLVFEKYSALKNFQELAQETAVILRNTIGFDTIMVDSEKVIVAESVHRNKVGEPISLFLLRALEERKSQIVVNGIIEITKNDPVKYSAIAISPIVVSGDLLGGLVCFSNQTTPTNSDLKSMSVITSYIASKLEF